MIYYLNKEELPTIKAPHDCVIKKVVLDNDFLVFEFCEDLARYDSVKNIHPGAKSLIIKMHLVDGVSAYKMKNRKIFGHREYYVSIAPEEMAVVAKKGSLEYLYHSVGYCSVLIQLFCKTYYAMSVSADYVEFIWKD